jgi:CheY-like chemotaxis protein
VRSEPGRGSVFTVRLRLLAVTGGTAGQIAAIPRRLKLADDEGGRVLVADDHPVNRQVLLGQLGLLGLAVDTAVDGVEALSMWQPGRYAAVLADVHMPRMDGYALAGEIRAREAASGCGRTPIVAVTANAMRGEEERCLAAGMDAFLAKPVSIARLGAVLGNWVALAPLADRGTGAFDRDMLRNWLGADPAAMRSLLAEFMQGAREHAHEIKAALDAADMATVTTTAHKLKGGALSVGAKALGKVAAALEEAARPGDCAACRDVLAALERELERAAEDIGA